MTALEMLKGLKANKDHLLWMNGERRQAAYHDGRIATRVDYNEALMVRPDPEIYVINTTDGETLSAA